MWGGNCKEDELWKRVGIKLGQQVLDVGFGSADELGMIIALVGDHGHVIGLERDVERLQQARAHLRQQIESQRVSIVQGCAEGIPLPSEYVDLVLCKGVLHEVSNIEHALAEMVRVLKPGGTLVIVDFHRFSRLKFELYRLLVFVLHRKLCGDLHPGFKPKELKNLLTRYNVEIEDEVLVGLGRLGPYRIPLLLLRGVKKAH